MMTTWLVAHHLPLSGRGGHHKEVLEVHNVGVPQPPLDVHLPDHVLRVVLVHEHVLNFFDRHKLPSLVVSGKADHAKRALPDGPKELVPLSDLRPTDRNREDDVSWWNRFFFLSRVMARRGRRGMITTCFPHITLHDEGTVSLVRELLDAASVGGHRRGSHAAAHRLGFPPPLDLQPRALPMETTPPPRPPTLALALLLASSPKKCL